MTELHDVIASAGTKCTGPRKQEQLSIERRHNQMLVDYILAERQWLSNQVLYNEQCKTHVLIRLEECVIRD